LEALLAQGLDDFGGKVFGHEAAPGNPARLHHNSDSLHRIRPDFRDGL